MAKKVHRALSRVAANQDFDLLYRKFLKLFYEAGDRERAEPIARRLESALTSSPELADSIRGEEVRSLIAELRGDFAEAARCREAEIRKILELHNLAVNTPNWEYVARQYDFSDVSDRLDLLAALYDEQGELDRAVSTLAESKRYCESHGIPFDGQDLFDELTRAQAIAPNVASDRVMCSMCDPMMTDEEIARRLKLIRVVATPSEGVENRIIRVEADRVIVTSERTEEERTILYKRIRSLNSKTASGRIIMTFRQILGLPYIRH